MSFYAVDVVNHVIERVSQEYADGHSKKLVLVEALLRSRHMGKGPTRPGNDGSGVCERCRHGYWEICAEYSVTKRYSGYWIVTAAVT